MSLLDDLAQLEGSPAEAPLRAAPSNRPTGQFIQRPNFPLSLPVPGDNPGAEGTLIDFEGGRAGHGDRLRVGHPQTVTSALAAAGQPDAFDRVMRLVAGMPSDELKAFPNRLWGTVDQELVNMSPSAAVGLESLCIAGIYSKSVGSLLLCFAIIHEAFPGTHAQGSMIDNTTAFARLSSFKAWMRLARSKSSTSSGSAPTPMTPENTDSGVAGFKVGDIGQRAWDKVVQLQGNGGAWSRSWAKSQQVS